jgi:16S rRNA (guanine966-N2)-methyltransferase
LPREGTSRISLRGGTRGCRERVSLRIVAGTLGGRRIDTPPGRSTRPTSDRVREALFSILGPAAVQGAAVLDLYAGSGALGMEALSRGAAAATFVDSDAPAAATIRCNLDALGLTEGRVHNRDVSAWLPHAEGGPFDLVFADPPYSSASRAAGRLSELLPPLLRDTSITVTESDRRHPLALTLPLVDERTYGDTRIAIHRGV